MGQLARLGSFYCVCLMPPFGATPFPCFFTPSSSVCLIFPGGCSLIVGDRELYGACHLCASFPEGGAVPATTRNSVGTSEKRGVGGDVSVVILQVKLWLISPLMGEITWGV